ncbi:MAG: SpoIIE family protein phosphatase [Leptospiraceae bacterium]|nr:SpoIIE family protein phosphatase [Leptospiraceae bacterium]
MFNPKILYVDDEEENLISFRFLFKKYFDIQIAKSAKEGLEILESDTIHIVISDQKMPKMSGVEFLKQVAKDFPDTSRILLTGFADIDSIMDAINLGEIYRFFTKPFQKEEMLSSLNNAMEVYRLRNQNQELLETLVENNYRLSIFNEELEKKVEERTDHLTKALNEISELKNQQDGDYFLTSLLIGPLARNSVNSDKFQIESFLKQKKEFCFRGEKGSLGGDINIAHKVKLMDKSYIVILNGDAMGKSTQGAGGAIVLGTAFEVIMERLRSFQWGKNLMPQEWLYNAYLELNQVFQTFEGLMMVSMILGIIEEDNGNFHFINAEHPKPILYRDKYASFLSPEPNYNKLGAPNFISQTIPISISHFKLNPSDIIIIGSDGKDDVVVGTNVLGNLIINENENRFLTCVEKSDADLKEIFKLLQKDAELMDDVSFIKITYKG